MKYIVVSNRKTDLIKVIFEDEFIKKIRGSYYLLGALLGKYKHAEVALPGGCDIGARPIDLHIKGFETLGVNVKIEHGNIVAKAEKLKGGNIYLDKVSVGATINIMMAASMAEAVGAQHIYIGVSQVDYSGYVDCRKVFIDAMENAINLGTVMSAERGQKIEVHAPFINMTKADEIRLGEGLVLVSDDLADGRGAVRACRHAGRGGAGRPRRGDHSGSGGAGLL